MRCETVGCDRYADWLVVRPDAPSRAQYAKSVCRKCRDELIGFYGWHLIWGMGRIPDPLPDPPEVDDAATRTRRNLETMLSRLPHDDPAYHRGLAEGTV